MPQRDSLDRTILQLLLSTYNSIRVGRIQHQNLLHSAALQKPRQGEELISLSCAGNIVFKMLSRYIFLA